MNKFFGRWNSYEGMAEDWFSSYDHFNVETEKYEKEPLPKDFPKEKDILIATYGGGSYEGDAFVLFKQRGKLFEVNGSHCSCYGLEGQWKPEETTVAALKMKGKKEASSSYYFLYEHDHDAYTAYWTLVEKLKEKP